MGRETNCKINRNGTIKTLIVITVSMIVFAAIYNIFIGWRFSDEMNQVIEVVIVISIMCISAITLYLSYIWRFNPFEVKEFRPDKLIMDISNYSEFTLKVAEFYKHKSYNNLSKSNDSLLLIRNEADSRKDIVAVFKVRKLSNSSLQSIEKQVYTILKNEKINLNSASLTLIVSATIVTQSFNRVIIQKSPYFRKPKTTLLAAINFKQQLVAISNINVRVGCERHKNIRNDLVEFIKS